MITCGTHKLIARRDGLYRCDICGMLCWYNRGDVAPYKTGAIYVSMDDPVAHKYMDSFAKDISCNDYIIMGIIK